MGGRIRAAVGGLLLSCMGEACIFQTSTVETVRVIDSGASEPREDSGGYVAPAGDCSVDSDCGMSECA
jgi:hypothetical protein